ncbi:MAG: exo-beta-1,3-glucanase [Cellvibrionales bacterium]|jgi:exo-beta-1,3-glucanase (GH17 family)|nr:exo-beta-1,3-glucanase [Cellvibrionales bacterium]MBT6579036.1 exo-beta-1,3-glucanase [Cellvibrionales bacterium]
MTHYKNIFLTISMVLLLACAPFSAATTTATSITLTSPTAAEILGNPKYPAFSYGGYREKTRDVVPTKDEIKDDIKILSALGIKVLRTYNTSQYPQASRLLAAIRELKSEDENFEMYVMLGAWIECHRAWTDQAKHTKGNTKNNKTEIATAVALANEYPDIVKVIAVGNEAMVQWAVTYFVYPKIILKWVDHLQDLKAEGKLSSDVWITSSDNFESWGGGDTHYQTKELAALIEAVDYVSLHTYPFHDSHYSPEFWGVLAEEESLSLMEQIEATMLRAKKRAMSQYQGAADYIASIDADKPIHIGETGWASIAGSSYGPTGSHAADELKEKLYYQHMRDWGHEAGMSMFYFEAFDEQWKDTGDATGSENHFGLITLNNEVKYTLWDEFDKGTFDGLTRNGKALTKSFGGDEAALMNAVLEPPYKSNMPKRSITNVNPKAVAGEPVTADYYVVTHDRLIPSKSNNMTYPSNTLKINPWEGTCNIIMTSDDVIEITTGTGDWWGSALEIQGDAGENLSQFESGYLYFELRGDPKLTFNIGYQTGNYLAGTQVNNFVSFGPKVKNPLQEEWKTYKVGISKIDKGADLTDVTGILFLHGISPKEKTNVYVRNIFYSKK